MPDGQDELSEPYVNEEFYEPDKRLPKFLALSGESVNAAEASPKVHLLVKVLRLAWYRGRILRELKQYRGRLKSATGSSAAFAAQMRVTRQTVGNWFSEESGIDPAHLEVVRRIFDLKLPELWQHELDLYGYLAAIASRGKTRKKKGSVLRGLTTFDFWCLFIAYRMPELRRRYLANDRESYLQLCQEIWLRATRRVGTSPTLKVPIETALERVLAKWGQAFAMAVTILDDECWTPPK